MFRSFSFVKFPAMDRNKIFGFLEKGRLRQALDLLLVYCREVDEHIYTDLIIISARYYTTEQAFSLNQIPFKEWMQARSEIIRALVRMMQEISETEVEDAG